MTTKIPYKTEEERIEGRKIYHAKYYREYYQKNKEDRKEVVKAYLERTDPTGEKRREYARNYYYNHHEKNLENNRRWRADNRDKHREWGRQWKVKNPVLNLYSSAKRSSKTRGIEFDISLDDIIISTHCPYLGIELTNIQGQGKQPSNISIDRIDNKKGYVKGNVQIISWLANNMKSCATEEQLIAFAKGVLRIHDRASSNQVSS